MKPNSLPGNSETKGRTTLGWLELLTDESKRCVWPGPSDCPDPSTKKPLPPFNPGSQPACAGGWVGAVAEGSVDKVPGDDAEHPEDVVWASSGLVGGHKAPSR
eukprot:3149846-Pyramimonas_sp.AAC.1